MNTETIDINPELLEWTQPFMEEHWNYKVAYGGRGAGAKSTSFARMLIVQAFKEPHRILCTRETMNSIEESVYSMLRSQVNELGLNKYFRFEKSNITCKHNGSRFFFTGLRIDPDHIKSFNNVTRCWVEEAHNVTKDSWKALCPTIFRNEGAEIWVSFNPRKPEDPTSDMFLENPRPHSLVVKLMPDDNPFFSQAMRTEMEFDFRKDPETAAHVWHGAYETKSEAQIFRGKYSVEEFTPDPTFDCWRGPYYGGDFGFGKDPAVFGKLWINYPNVYVEWMKYGHGTELNDLFALFDSIPGAVRRTKDPLTKHPVLMPREMQYPIRCDSSRPDTISLLCSQGLNAVPAKKGPGSIEEGISFLRMFDKVIIHPRNKEFEQEARLYHHKVDKITGIVSTSIVDAWNHGWDTARYALEPEIAADVKTELVEYDARSEHIPVSSDLDAIDAGFGMPEIRIF